MLISKKKLEQIKRKADYDGFTRGYERGLSNGINRGILTERMGQQNVTHLKDLTFTSSWFDTGQYKVPQNLLALEARW